MSELYASPSFGIALTVLVYWVGVKIQKKTGLVICNNMIIAVGLLIAILAVFHIPYDDYNQGGSIINMFLGPATACLAVSIYSKIDLLKKNWLPVLVGCLVGVVTSVGSILIMCRLFGLDRDMTVSLLPKSVTTPIAVAVSEGQNGMVAITVAAVIITGIIGAVTAGTVFKLFRIKEPVAQGLACGTAAHAIGTTKALEMGEIQGAMSSLAIVASGLVTVFAAPAVASWI